jgi:hypothetical protein
MLTAVCREVLLKLQSANEGLTSQVQAAKGHIDSNMALKKEVADLRFRLIMSGTDAPPDARNEWGVLKDSLVRQVQAAESKANALEEQLATASAKTFGQGGAKPSSGLASRGEELERVWEQLEAGKKKIEDLELQRERLQAEVPRLKACGSSGVDRPPLLT